MRSILMLLLIMLILPLHADEDFDRQQILQRIQPVGSVRLDGQSDKSVSDPAVEKAEPTVKKERGQEIYDTYCAVCHRDGVAGAPKFHNETEWKPRLAEKKIEGLTLTAIKGINAMPAKGTCGECNENDIKLAIQYMLPKS
ncbi:MAG: c-type cytochrome [Legionella sp.]|nr:c-type cytochrome [Legionella sp.]